MLVDMVEMRLSTISDQLKFSFGLVLFDFDPDHDGTDEREDGSGGFSVGRQRLRGSQGERSSAERRPME